MAPEAELQDQVLAKADLSAPTVFAPAATLVAKAAVPLLNTVPRDTPEARVA